MCDKICAQKIFEKSRQIEIDDINKNGKYNLFGKKVKYIKKAKNVCKNCCFLQK